MAEGKIKVLHVLTDKNVGGAGRWLLNYLRYHDRREFLVKVVLPLESALIPLLTPLDVELILCSDMTDSSFDRKAFGALKEIFIDEQPFIVHTHASLTARMAAKAIHVPVVLNTKHCMESAPGSLAKRIARREVNHRFSDKTIAVSKAVRKSMIAGGVSPKRVVTIYNGVEKIHKLNDEQRAELFASLGVAAGRKAVGIVARLEEVKDHAMFLQAVYQVVQEREDIQFYVIGDGSLRYELQTYAMELGVEDFVTFTGFVDDVEKIEGALDLAVLTSKEEALCLSLIETMSVGIPAIGTDTGGVGEVILHGQNGYLVPVGNADRLAKRILELLSDEELYQNMSQTAEAFVAEHFSAQQMTARIERLYLEELK